MVILQVLRFDFKKFRILEIFNFHPCIYSLMDSSIQIDTINLGLHKKYFRSHDFQITQKIVISLVNSADPDEKLYSVCH